MVIQSNVDGSIINWERKQQQSRIWEGDQSEARGNQEGPQQPGEKMLRGVGAQHRQTLGWTSQSRADVGATEGQQS